LSIQYPNWFKLKLSIRLTTLTKNTIVIELMNLIDIVCIIGNFHQELSISVILKLSIQYSNWFKLKLSVRLTTLTKNTIVTGLMNLIDVVYIIGNFDQELSISVIFYKFAHLHKSLKKLHHFSKVFRFWESQFLWKK